MSRSPGKLPAPPTDGQVCTLFAADIAGFTAPGRDDDIRWYLHGELYKLLEEAFDGAGIRWNRCFREDRGDGVLTVIPPGAGCKNIIDPLPERLRGLIRRHNHVFRDAAAIQLRTAAHIGPVDHDGHGFIGSDINLLFRMLNARPLKRALTNSSAELALIISGYLYHNIVCRYPSLISPDAFRPVRFQDQHISTQAWAYLPSFPPQRAKPQATPAARSPDPQRPPAGLPIGSTSGAGARATAPARGCP